MMIFIKFNQRISCISNNFKTFNKLKKSFTSQKIRYISSMTSWQYPQVKREEVTETFFGKEVRLNI